MRYSFSPVTQPEDLDGNNHAVGLSFNGPESTWSNIANIDPSRVEAKAQYELIVDNLSADAAARIF